ncbi:hypothetical protein [Nonomuraea sp. B19D2]|uniref:hypothetical protein n=1 Tax=Nonomuraea sp. B19D2 TaxID=3159561 RepID=UPI0032DBB066
MSPEQHRTTAVFVNQSGRRRKLIMIGSIAGSVLALALLAVVIGGMLSSTTLSVNGWPGERPGAASPDRTPTSRPRLSEQPTPSATRPVVTVSPSRRPTTSATRPVRPSATSELTSPQPERTTPRSSRDPGQSSDPTADPTTAAPTDAGNEPPGQVKTPPGLDPDRTKGPKR